MKIMTKGSLSENGTTFWLPSSEVNALFRLELNQGYNATLVGLFHDCVNARAWIIKKVISWENKLFFFSLFSYEMWVMERNGDSIQHYTYFKGPVSMVDCVEVFQGRLYIISRTPFTILVIDLNSRTVTRLKWEKDAEWKDVCCGIVAQKDDKIFSFTHRENNAYLGIIDCENQDVCFNKIDQLRFAKAIGVVGENVFVLGFSNNSSSILLKYDLSGKQVLESYELTKIKVEGNRKVEYLKTVSYGNKLFFIPWTMGKFMVFDTESNSEMEIDCSEIALYESYQPHEAQQIQNLLYLFPGSMGKIVKLDLETFESTMIDVDVYKEEYDKALAGVMEWEGKFTESYNINLCNLLSLSQMMKEPVSQDKFYGKEIYGKLFGNK